MKRTVLTLLILSLFPMSSYAQVKESDLAGKWYAASPEKLRSELDSYLKKAEPPVIDGKILAIISPHAGFAYSGPVAAYGFKAIENQGIKTAVIVGFSHRMAYDGIAVLDYEGFLTPLGKVQIEREITTELIARHKKIYDYPEAFNDENSIELIVPFLQEALGSFKIVLVAMGNQSYENSRILGDALYETLKGKEGFVMVASTDMCHYLPYQAANQLDEKTIAVVKEFNPEKLYGESLAEGNRLMCGYGAVCATMIAAKKLGADRIEILKHANSGDTSGQKQQVVGYLSAAMIKSEIRNPKSETNPKSEIQNSDLKQTTNSKLQTTNEENSMLNEEQRKKMLKLARDTITHYLKTGKKMEAKDSDPVLNKEMGAFVTLHERGELRGCIGNMVARGPFYLTVRDMAIEAATGDPRFRPVTLDEMKNIDIEISALSPLEKIKDPEKIEMGKHGVIVKKGFYSGVYLPQVATETGWTRDEFMNSLCGHKAGMNPDAWKKGECEIYTFTAEVFGEKNTD